MSQVLVVGLDGSPASVAAARWAAREALLSGIPLRLLQVLPNPSGRHWPARESQDHLAAASAEAERIADELRAEHPGLLADTATVAGNPVTELLRGGDQADMLVLGSRGRGGFDRLLVGSTAMNVTSRAHCPVVLVRDGSTGRTPAHEVTVGVDPARDGDPVLDFAFDRAAERRSPLRAVQAWLPPVVWVPASVPTVPGPGPGAGSGPGRLDGIRELETRMLRDSVERVAKSYPDVPVDSLILPGSAGQVLVEESAQAGLLVLGRPRHRAVSALGSALHSAIHYSDCAVAVVPHL